MDEAAIDLAQRRKAGDPVEPGPEGPGATPAAPPRVARRVRAERAGFGRFLSVSLVAHTALLAAGLTGGAAYSRARGVEPMGAVVVFAAAEPMPEPAVAESIVEPERSVEPEPAAAEPEPTVSTAEDLPEPAMATPLSSELARANEPFLGRPLPSLNEPFGDPTQSIRRASLAKSGLDIAMAGVPEVSECCGEPQPPPESDAETYVYPKVVSMARARFPEKSQRLGEQGSVLLEMSVDAAGKVSGVRVIESSGHSRLDDCAAAAAWDWVFEPARRNGRAEAAIAHHRYTFRLTDARG